MGIRFLQTFLCNDVPDGYFPVNIGQEILNWQRQNNNSRPVIVFDVMGLLNITLQSNVDVVLGGRHHFVLRKYEEFFRKLKVDLNAELVFYCDGRVQKNKNDIWIERQNDKYAKTITIFDQIEQSDGCLEFINKLRTDDFPGLTTTIFGLVNLCRRYGEFKLSMVELTLNVTELSRFATRNNAVAVIADDTDFLIYEGNWKYWSARSLDLVQLTTMEYCRPALRMALALSPKQLPIFATLAGNDVIRHDYVQPFHRRLRLTRYNRFQKLAQFVRSNKTDVSSISQAIFQSTTNKFVSLVEESVGMYDINYETPNEVDLLTQQSAFETCFYTFLNAQPYNITLIFSDLRRKDFLSYLDVLLPIVKRQIGFVRQHKNEQPDYQQTIIGKIDHIESYKELSIAPEYPKIKLPSLVDITFDANNESLHSLRFELLTWLIFGCDQTFKIEEIPTNYMVVVTTIKLLLRINQITVTEADALLLCVNKIRQETVPNDIHPGKVTTRSIVVSHLYSRMHNTILICFKFVGLERLIDYLIFDGPYYMVLLKILSSQSSQSGYEQTIAEIQEYRKFLV